MVIAAIHGLCVTALPAKEFLKHRCVSLPQLIRTIVGKVATRGNLVAPPCEHLIPPGLRKIPMRRTANAPIELIEGAKGAFGWENRAKLVSKLIIGGVLA